MIFDSVVIDFHSRIRGVCELVFYLIAFTDCLAIFEGLNNVYNLYYSRICVIESAAWWSPTVVTVDSKLPTKKCNLVKISCLRVIRMPVLNLYLRCGGKGATKCCR